MSRPKTDPERIEMERDEFRQKFDRAFHGRFGGSGYGMVLVFIAAFSWLIADVHGWGMGIFCCVLMVAVLELGYRLWARH